MDPVNISEFEALARERMSQQAFDYVAGGADDEITLAKNRAAFERFTLYPRVLIDVSTVLRDEVELALALCGCPSVEAISTGLVGRR